MRPYFNHLDLAYFKQGSGGGVDPSCLDGGVNIVFDYSDPNWISISETPPYHVTISTAALRIKTDYTGDPSIFYGYTLHYRVLTATTVDGSYTAGSWGSVSFGGYFDLVINAGSVVTTEYPFVKIQAYLTKTDCTSIGSSGSPFESGIVTATTDECPSFIYFTYPNGLTGEAGTIEIDWSTSFVDVMPWIIQKYVGGVWTTYDSGTSLGGGGYIPPEAGTFRARVYAVKDSCISTPYFTSAAIVLT